MPDSTKAGLRQVMPSLFAHVATWRLVGPSCLQTAALGSN